MRLGNHTVGIRKLVPRVPAEVDQYGRPVRDQVDRVVRWCLVVPSSRVVTDSAEPRDRSAPRIVGTEFYGPAGLDLDAADVVVWPVDSFVPDAPDSDTGTVTGQTWQVEGEVGVWDQSTEARLRRAA